MHRNIAPAFLPEAAGALQAAGVTLKADEAGRSILAHAGVEAVEPATAEDWQTEYGALILAIRVVDSSKPPSSTSTPSARGTPTPS